MNKPLIGKTVLLTPTTIAPTTLSRCEVGYVASGEKLIFRADVCHRVGAGEIYLLEPGTHYTRSFPGPDGTPFEQVAFQLSAEELQRLLVRLNQLYQVNTARGAADISSDSPEESVGHAVLPAWDGARLFFEYISKSLDADAVTGDPVLQNMLCAELVYLLLSQPDNALRTKLLGQVDSDRDAFQQAVHAHIFTHISVEALAKRCNRSLTSFKKEFFNVFGLSPHQWFLRQRLIHARSLLISTDRAVSKIGIDCCIPNTSHFIKLFRKQYQMTPAHYRARYRKAAKSEEKLEQMA